MLIYMFLKSVKDKVLVKLIFYITFFISFNVECSDKAINKVLSFSRERIANNFLREINNRFLKNKSKLIKFKRQKNIITKPLKSYI